VTADSHEAEGLVLELAGRRVRFMDAASFDYALQPRARVSLEAQAWLAGQSGETIEDERRLTRRLRRWLEAELPRRLGEPAAGLPDSLPADALTMLADEHQWGELLEALRKGVNGHGAFATVALVRLGEYLAERDAALARAGRRSGPAVAAAAAAAVRPADAPGAEADDPLGATLDGLPASPSASAVPHRHRGEDPTAPSRWAPLPRGRAEGVALPPDRPLNLRCADVVLCLRHSGCGGGADALATQDEFRLKPGANVIGRDPACDVVIHEAGHQVSRMHVLVVDHGNGQLAITDLSRNGTFIERGSE
jgi:hypothetical protein